jgi:hypothetical protein
MNDRIFKSDDVWLIRHNGIIRERVIRRVIEQPKIICHADTLLSPLAWDTEEEFSFKIIRRVGYVRRFLGIPIGRKYSV